MIQLVYASRPFGFDITNLHSILNDARSFNAANDITGALICRNDLYLQMLEGPEEIVLPLYERIKRDDRHVEVTELVRRPIVMRLFPAWSMRDDPVEDWMWSRDEIDKGAVENSTPAEVIAIFTRLAAKPLRIV